jgi:uncharacterized protein YciI
MNFLIVGLDGTDDGAMDRRMKARPDHIAFGDELMKSGNLWYASALLHDDGTMKGSMYFVDFEDEDALQDYLKQEPYVLGEVWRDIQIHKANVRDPWLFNRPQEWFEERTGA